MGVVYTKEQQQVIDLRNRNILVSAAAGSGKTAVLVERIITQLTKDAVPIDVDRLLVVTYTEAAAAEMKERIHKAIEKALEENPGNVHLQRQATLVHNAQVTTIHSFCLSVIRDYFHTIDLDPGFRIAEEGELKLLKKDVLEEVLEKWYQESSAAFITFVESFATGKDDRKLEEIVLQLYEYSRSYPNPGIWLNSLVEKYHVENEKDLEEAPFVKIVLHDVRNVLKDIVERLEFALEICKKEDGPQAYIPALESDIQTIEMLLEAGKFEKLQQGFQNIKWARLGSNRKKMVSEEDINAVKEIRGECKDQIEGLQKQFFYDSVLELQKGMLAAEGNMKVLVELVMEFAEAFTAKKQSRNMIDFSDMEHYALKILTQQGEEGLIPSAVAKEYQEKYLEVMIDEYQDSNYIQEAILTSVSSISQGKYNIFMVGDVKQSIYRFRLSRPELFIEKYNTYDTKDGVKQRIDLHKNFRSRREVLESTNFIFRQIMTKEFGGIEYDDKAALYVGAEYKEFPGENDTELCLIDTTELPEGLNKREIEARAVARKIKALVESQTVYDKQTGVYRKAKYGDIVILTRSIKGWADIFVRVLSQEGVPAYSVSKEGYFETREIQMILNYLKILDNPRQDIPFAAALAGPFARMKSEELAVIKSEMYGKTFYEKVCNYLECGKNADLKYRLEIFMAQYKSFRRKVPYTSIHDLLNRIIEETGYGNYIAALPGGEQRAANLEMLLEKAVSFESTSYKGLFHFVRYIEQLYKYEVDFGEANIVDENADVVRIMSIHKSKGLEFPIVFVVGMDKGFNLQDIRSSIVIHPELGVGIDYVDTEKRTKHPSLLKKMIQKEVEKETIAEEMRVLYVAMTRAREKLILTGTVSNIESKMKKMAYLNYRTKTKLPYSCIVMVKKYFDWLLPAVYRRKNYDIPIKVERIVYEDLVLDEIIEEFEESITKENLLGWDHQKEYDSNMKRQIAEQFSYSYPYMTEQKTKQKISVSELKKKAYMEEAEIEEEAVIPLLPRFLQEEQEMKGASRGTAYHRVLELLNFSLDYTYGNLKAAIEEMVQSEKITAEAAESVRYKDILTFLESSVGRRIQKAARNGKFHVEQPFVLAMEKEDFDTVLIQGIIDVYFEEEDEIVVLDYKTDKVYRSEELIERYQTQLEYYAKALERLTGKKVKQKMIYSFTLQKEIEV